MNDMNTHSNTSRIDGHNITRERWWNADNVRHACIKNNLYTRGTNEQYSAMLDMVRYLEPTTAAMYRIAKDIYEHSEDQTITNVMYILETDAVVTTFMMDGIA